MNGYCVYAQYGYHRSGIEGSAASFKGCYSVQVNTLGSSIGVNTLGSSVGVNTLGSSVGVNTLGSRVLEWIR